MIHSEFISCISRNCEDVQKQHELWQEIENKYSNTSRHYHTLDHLNTLLSELKVLKDQFENWDTIVFAIAYHDAIYNTLKTNNEEKSAALAKKRLTEILFPTSDIDLCHKLILATKVHNVADHQTNLFTDADLAILGSSPEVYARYAAQIRREYRLYPDLVYNPGRQKVLQHFLSMTRIYKTQHFAERYEAAARVNVLDELKTLGKNR